MSCLSKTSLKNNQCNRLIIYLDCITNIKNNLDTNFETLKKLEDIMKEINDLGSNDAIIAIRENIQKLKEFMVKTEPEVSNIQNNFENKCRDISIVNNENSNIDNHVETLHNNFLTNNNNLSKISNLLVENRKHIYQLKNNTWSTVNQIDKLHKSSTFTKHQSNIQDNLFKKFNNNLEKLRKQYLDITSLFNLYDEKIDILNDNVNIIEEQVNSLNHKMDQSININNKNISNKEYIKINKIFTLEDITNKSTYNCTECYNFSKKFSSIPLLFYDAVNTLIHIQKLNEHQIIYNISHKISLSIPILNFKNTFHKIEYDFDIFQNNPTMAYACNNYENKTSSLFHQLQTNNNWHSPILIQKFKQLITYLSLCSIDNYQAIAFTLSTSFGKEGSLYYIQNDNNNWSNIIEIESSQNILIKLESILENKRKMPVVFFWNKDNKMLMWAHSINSQNSIWKINEIDNLPYMTSVTGPIIVKQCPAICYVKPTGKRGLVFFRASDSYGENWIYPVNIDDNMTNGIVNMTSIDEKILIAYFNETNKKFSLVLFQR